MKTPKVVLIKECPPACSKLQDLLSTLRRLFHSSPPWRSTSACPQLPWTGAENRPSGPGPTHFEVHRQRSRESFVRLDKPYSSSTVESSLSAGPDNSCYPSAGNEESGTWQRPAPARPYPTRTAWVKNHRSQVCQLIV